MSEEGLDMRKEFQKTIGGSANLSRGARLVMAILRIYVFVMMGLFVYKFFQVVGAR